MRFSIALVAGILGTGLPIATFAQPAATATARVDSLFARWNTKSTPGCAVGVSRGGRSIFERAYGMADLEHDVPATPATIYEAGSVSKQFTAAAVVLLAQDGKLSLDDDVRTHIPEVPDYGTPITIRHLLTHTSGLRDWGSVAAIAGMPRGSRAYTHAHVLDIVSRQKALNYPPGAAYSYTNTGYNLLVMIVDRVSGMPFAEFTRTRLFEPIGMRRTQWRDDYTRIVKDRAIAYEARFDGGLSMDMPFENVHGNGGLLTTVGDLLLWTENLETGKVGGPTFVKEMHRQARLTNGREIVYASGLRVTRYNDIPEVSHTGTTAGYRAFLARYPQQRVAVALLCNTGSASSTALGHAIADAFLGAAVRRVASPQPPAGIAVPAEALRANAGLFRDSISGESIRLVVADGVLRIDRGAALIPLTRTTFQVGNSARRLEFERLPGSTRPRIRETNDPEDAVVYEPVPEFTPTPVDLGAYVGEYYSADAEVSLTATVENGELVLRRRPASRMRLTPVYADAFDGPFGRIRFMRDATGRITELSVRQERVWDLRFTRR
jgi:CubicO group peptidase (beta-lactamase class C family)